MHRSSGLDWNAIESEVQRQTTTLAIERGSSSSYAAGAAAFSRASNPFLNASDALGVSVDTNAAVYLPPPPGVYDTSAGQFSSTADSSSVAALSREVMELRAIINQQNKKIGVMERMFDSYNDILESSSATQISTNDKLTQIESELRSNGKIFANASRERAELSYSLQNIDNKFGTLDQYVRSLVTDYTTKESFQKLVVATVEQIDRLRGTLESNRIKVMCTRLMPSAEQCHSVTTALLYLLCLIRAINRGTLQKRLCEPYTAFEPIAVAPTAAARSWTCCYSLSKVVMTWALTPGV